jgi:hypothetical protein
MRARGSWLLQPSLQEIIVKLAAVRRAFFAMAIYRVVSLNLINYSFPSHKEQRDLQPESKACLPASSGSPEQLTRLRLGAAL